MASETTVRVLAASVMLLIGGGAGYVARGALERGTRGEPEPVAAAELANVQRALERIELALAERERMTAAPTTAATPSTRSAVDASLEQRLRELVERLEPVASDRAPAANVLVVPEGRPRELPARVLVDDQRAREERTRRYQLWTYQQVAAAFGRPDRVFLQEGALVWQYLRGSTDPEDLDWFTLHFQDGLVVGVYDG